MKKFFKYIFISVVVVSICSCSLDIINETDIKSNKSVLQIIGIVTGFDEKEVTKADDATIVNEMTMLIFGSDGNIVGKPINVVGAMPTFVIDTQNDASYGILGSADNYKQAEYTKDPETMSQCSIYIVANAWHILKDLSIENFSDFEKIRIEISEIGIPAKGIPMIGTHDSSVKFDLCDASNSTSTIATIPLIKLYSKVNVKIKVNSTQISKIPEFKLISWELYNIPRFVNLHENESLNEDNYIYDEGTGARTEISGGSMNIYDVSAQTGSYCQFTFYIPENRAQQSYNESEYDYPDGISDSDKQKYKPQLLGSHKAPYVEFKGIYTTHQGTQKYMTYRIFLGQNEIDDFVIKRNQELNNIVIIRGASKSSGFSDDDNRVDTDNSNISVDYRVDSELTGSSNFTYYIERETMLDCHIEVRPLVLEFAEGTTGSIRIDLTNRTVEAGEPGEDETWIGVKSSRQDYFVPSLTSDSSPSNIVVPAPENGKGGLKTIWLYFDDNISVYDRTGSITLTYCTDAEGKVGTTENYVIDVKQYRLLEVQICNYMDYNVDGVTYSVPNPKEPQHYLYIEWFEEYLNYYDPLDDPNTEMKYDGLYWAVNNNTYGSGCYDNYYKGYEYTEKIIITDNNINPANKIETNLYTAPKTAAEYCYLKTKRTEDKNIDSENGRWFLPGIREMEQIMVKWYAEFIEFQNNLYWSSASAKKRVIISYREDAYNARATKVIPVSTTQGAYFTYVQSSEGTEGYRGKQEKLRIRAAYRKSDNSRITD